MHQGDVFLSANKFEEAIAAYREAQGLKPNDPTPNLKIADALRWQQELANINQQQNQQENQVNVQFESLIQQGDHLLAYDLFDESISSYEQAMALKPGDQTAYARIKEANRRKQAFSYVQTETMATTTMGCITDDSEFSNIMTTIKSQSFADDKKKKWLKDRFRKIACQWNR